MPKEPAFWDNWFGGYVMGAVCGILGTLVVLWGTGRLLWR
jgi:hypothetical protein